MPAKRDADAWEFAVRFRRSGFGWKTQPAILRIRQALAELGNVARRDLLHAGEGRRLSTILRQLGMEFSEHPPWRVVGWRESRVYVPAG